MQLKIDNKNIIEQLLPPPEQPIIEDANQTSEITQEKTVVDENLESSKTNDSEDPDEDIPF